jgi:hypothetical protein
VFDTFSANLAAAKEGCGRAQKSVIVQRLHNGNMGFPASGVNRRGDHEQCVMDVHEVRLLFSEHLAYFQSRVAGPDGSLRQPQSSERRIRLNLAIAFAVDYNLMPGSREQLTFLIEHHIFSARLPVSVMGEKDLHFSNKIRWPVWQ